MMKEKNILFIDSSIKIRTENGYKTIIKPWGYQKYYVKCYKTDGTYIGYSSMKEDDIIKYFKNTTGVKYDSVWLCE